jgi:hypothetical protein
LSEIQKQAELNGENALRHYILAKTVTKRKAKAGIAE